MVSINSPSDDEKKVGMLDVSDVPSIAEVPAELLPAHAAEYKDFLVLKAKFEADPKAYNSLLRRRMIPSKETRCSFSKLTS